MIVFDLKCGSGHVFEGWFGSSGDYGEQKERGLVQCPICGSAEVAKAVMAPAVGRKSNTAAPAPPASLDRSEADRAKQMLGALAAEQKKLLQSSDFVGDRFAEEARAIHLGDAAARSIHGRATREQTLGLLEEGIPVAPLPFPVIAPGEEN
jgi:hypothetical protein